MSTYSPDAGRRARIHAQADNLEMEFNFIYVDVGPGCCQY
jgi:phosphoribosylpyrophosphate synthetase